MSAPDVIARALVGAPLRSDGLGDTLLPKCLARPVFGSDPLSSVIALDVGADDYVTKPFGMNELLARLRAALRRTSAAHDIPVVETASFSVDLAGKRAHTSDGEPVHLTPTEGHVLEVLIAHEGKLVTGRQLLQEVWGPPTRPRRTTCGCTWRSCAASSRPIPRGHATCSPSPAWATASCGSNRGAEGHAA